MLQCTDYLDTEKQHMMMVLNNSEDGFQWGLGANYAVTENIGVFADYTNLFDDSV